MRAALCALVAFVVGACFKPAPQEGFACGLDNWCPGPLFCAADHTCRSADLPGDGGRDDGPATDGPTADGPAADGSPGPSKLAFVTSQAFSVSSSLKSITDANTACMNAAMAGQRAGTYLAWLSVNGQPASNRIAAPNGWHRTDDKPFASDLQSLLRGEILNPLSKTETGEDLNATVFTGTNEAGGATGNDCRALTTNSQTEVITVGSSTSVTRMWTNTGELSCDQPGHLYCLQIDPPEPLMPAREPRSTAFLSTP